MPPRQVRHRGLPNKQNLNKLSSIKYVLNQLSENLIPYEGRGLIYKNEIWEREPVSSWVFFKDYLKEANYPEQQRLVDKLLGTDPLIWNTEVKEAVLLWGMGCISSDTIIKDYITNEERTVKEWADDNEGPCVLTHKGNIKEASVPFKKGIATLYQVTTESGESIEVTKEHKFFISTGLWRPLKELGIGIKIAVLGKTLHQLLRYDKIKSIKYIGEGEYYDLTVPDDNSYLSQGIFHHNSGKDHTSAKLTAYVLYWLLCLKDPQAYFNIGQGTAIDIVNISINSYLAKNIFFRDLKHLIKRAVNPNTKENVYTELGLNLSVKGSIKDRQIDCPKNIMVHSRDSEHETVIGMNPLLVIFDEVGGFKYSDAESLYDNTSETQRSRFAETGKILLLSYPRDYNDFICSRYRNVADNPSVYRSRKATWEVNIRVKKEDLAEEYTKNPEKAERVYECNVTLGENTYFRYPELIAATITRQRPNPIVDGKQRIFNLNNIKFHDWFRGINDIWYFIHVDLATGKEGRDCAGFAMGHAIKGMPIKFDRKIIDELHTKGIPMNQFREGTGIGAYVDLIFQLKAYPGREIIFDDIIQFIRALRDLYHFDIRKVTMDGWQSLGELQRLKNAGIQSDVYSVDRGLKGYDTLKGLIYRALFNSYYNVVLLRELRELLLVNGKKIEHPTVSYLRHKIEGDEKGSKDVADAAAGLSVSIIENYNANTAMWFQDIVQSKYLPFRHPQEIREENEIRRVEEAETRRILQEMEAQAELVRYGEEPINDFL